jgi:hypothetical protein
MICPDNFRNDYAKVNTLASGQSLNNQMQLLNLKRSQMGYQGKFEIEEYWSANQKSVDRMSNQISPFSPGTADKNHLNVNIDQVTGIVGGE